MDRKNYQIIQGVMLTLNAVKGKHLAVQQRDSSPLAQNDRYKTFSGLARRSSHSSGEELTTPASPGITSIKNYKLKMTRSVMLSDRRESPWDETKHLALKFFTEHVLSETARFFAMLRMTFILHFTFYILNCLFRAGTDVLQKILRGKIFWLAPCLARLHKYTQTKVCNYIK